LKPSRNKLPSKNREKWTETKLKKKQARHVGKKVVNWKAAKDHIHSSKLIRENMEMPLCHKTT